MKWSVRAAPLAWEYDGNGTCARTVRTTSTGIFRTQDYAQGTIVDFFLDGMREIQEMASCTGIVLKQYVHGPILDEVIARDTPLPQGWQDFSARCETSTGPGIVPMHCPSTLNPPPVLSLSGSCGPCYSAWHLECKDNTSVTFGLGANAGALFTFVLPYSAGCDWGIYPWYTKWSLC